jgi:hypothetical protein
MGQALTPKIMTTSAAPAGDWSSSMAERLLAALTDEELAQHWGIECAADAATDSQDVRTELIEWARDDDELRDWIRHAWRTRNDNVVAVTESCTVEELSSEIPGLLDDFEPEDILLALLTEDDDGPELANSFVHGVTDEAQRRTLLRTLHRLLGACAESRIRVVIFGGHPRYGLRLMSNIEALGPFDIRWRAFERENNSSADDKSVAGALHGAAAAIVVTGMASHSLARMVKAFAQQRGIPYRCVEKLTESQIAAALIDLFPTD